MTSNSDATEYHRLVELPLNEATSGVNENSRHRDKEYNVEQSNLMAKPRRTKKAQVKDEDSLSAAFSSWLFDHQIGISVNLLLLLFLTHISFSRARVHTRKFFSLSYVNIQTGKYAIGWDDAFLVAFWIVLLTGVRVVVMEYIFEPLAQLRGLKGKGKVRFAEQAWLIIYAGTSTAVGTYIMYNSDYWMNIPMVWAGWPGREMTALFKWYYLVQFAFWIQQIVVVNIEERRKDHWQMFSHHIITCGLMFWSYGYHYYQVGNVILVIMDSCDLALSTAKVLKYLKYRTACDIAFGVFMVQWFALRHCAYLAICWSVAFDLPVAIPFGCYTGTGADRQGPFPPPNNWTFLLEPFRNPKGKLCHTDGLSVIFLTMLLLLQVLLAIWFGMIINVAYKVITGAGAEDVRSDDEEEEEIHEPVPQKTAAYKPPIEEEVDVSELRFTDRKPKFKKPSVASGVSLPHDRKELLGRIGCDKQA